MANKIDEDKLKQLNNIIVQANMAHSPFTGISQTANFLASTKKEQANKKNIPTQQLADDIDKENVKPEKVKGRQQRNVNQADGKDNNQEKRIKLKNTMSQAYLAQGPASGFFDTAKLTAEANKEEKERNITDTQRPASTSTTAKKSSMALRTRDTGNLQERQAGSSESNNKEMLQHNQNQYMQKAVDKTGRKLSDNQARIADIQARLKFNPSPAQMAEAAKEIALLKENNRNIVADIIAEATKEIDPKVIADFMQILNALENAEAVRKLEEEAQKKVPLFDRNAEMEKLELEAEEAKKVAEAKEKAERKGEGAKEKLRVASKALKSIDNDYIEHDKMTDTQLKNLSDAELREIVTSNRANISIIEAIAKQLTESRTESKETALDLAKLHPKLAHIKFETPEQLEKHIDAINKMPNAQPDPDLDNILDLCGKYKEATNTLAITNDELHKRGKFDIRATAIAVGKKIEITAKHVEDKIIEKASNNKDLTVELVDEAIKITHEKAAAELTKKSMTENEKVVENSVDETKQKTLCEQISLFSDIPFDGNPQAYLKIVKDSDDPMVKPLIDKLKGYYPEKDKYTVAQDLQPKNKNVTENEITPDEPKKDISDKKHAEEDKEPQHGKNTGKQQDNIENQIEGFPPKDKKDLNDIKEQFNSNKKPGQEEKSDKNKDNQAKDADNKGTDPDKPRTPTTRPGRSPSM